MADDGIHCCTRSGVRGHTIVFAGAPSMAMLNSTPVYIEKWILPSRNSFWNGVRKWRSSVESSIEHGHKWRWRPPLPKPANQSRSELLLFGNWLRGSQPVYGTPMLLCSTKANQIQISECVGWIMFTFNWAIHWDIQYSLQLARIWPRQIGGQMWSTVDWCWSSAIEQLKWHQHPLTTPLNFPIDPSNSKCVNRSIHALTSPPTNKPPEQFKFY